MTQYRIAIDIGGTFTDLIGVSDDGRVLEAKVPSDRERPEGALRSGLDLLADQAGLDGAAQLLGRSPLVIQGTTVAVNAVLQRTGVKTGLLTTEGFRDTLEIRQGYKEERYLFAYTPPEPLVARPLRRVARERVDHRGGVLTPLVEQDVIDAAATFREQAVEAVAVCFLWSFAHPAHEQRAAELLREELPGVFVTTSVEVLPQIREYNRISTTALNAYVGPIVGRHVARTEAILRDLGFEGRIRYVQSNGGLAEAEEVTRRPVLLLVSGPAAGPAAGLQYAELAGRDFITIDMGGTSFDTCLVRDGLPEMRSISDLNGYRVATPLIDVHAIGSGGGSIATLHDGLLRVGPESAEANPGPACYRLGGSHSTVTDANVVLGLLNPRELLGGRFVIDASLAREAIARDVAEPSGLEVGEAAAGIIEVVGHDMADAIREITVRRGYDPRRFSLVVGGGAGGLHAVQLATELGIERVVVPRVASALCAFGAAVADVRHDYVRALVGDTRTLDFTDVAALFDDLERDGRSALAAEGVGDHAIQARRTLEVRYRDQVWELPIDVSELDLTAADARDDVESRFHARHQEVFDFSQPGHTCELISITATVIGASPPLERAEVSAGNDPLDLGDAPKRSVRFTRSQPAQPTPVIAGSCLPDATAFAGPLIVEEPNTTVVVPPGWQLTLDRTNDAYLLCDRNGGADDA